MARIVERAPEGERERKKARINSILADVKANQKCDVVFKSNRYDGINNFSAVFFSSYICIMLVLIWRKKSSSFRLFTITLFIIYRDSCQRQRNNSSSAAAAASALRP